MPPAYIIVIVSLVIAHLACDAYGVPMGRQIKWLFSPFVLAIYVLTVGRVDFRNCAECNKREAYLDSLFCDVPWWKRAFRFLTSFLTSK